MESATHPPLVNPIKLTNVAAQNSQMQQLYSLLDTLQNPNLNLAVTEICRHA